MATSRMTKMDSGCGMHIRQPKQCCASSYPNIFTYSAFTRATKRTCGSCVHTFCCQLSSRVRPAVAQKPIMHACVLVHGETHAAACYEYMRLVSHEPTLCTQIKSVMCMEKNHWSHHDITNSLSLHVLLCRCSPITRARPVSIDSGGSVPGCFTKPISEAPPRARISTRVVCW